MYSIIRVYYILLYDHCTTFIKSFLFSMNSLPWQNCRFALISFQINFPSVFLADYFASLPYLILKYTFPQVHFSHAYMHTLSPCLNTRFPFATMLDEHTLPISKDRFICWKGSNAACKCQEERQDKDLSNRRARGAEEEERDFRVAQAL